MPPKQSAAAPALDPISTLVESAVERAVDRKLDELAELLGARPPAKLLNRSELGQWLGVSTSLIKKLEAEGLPVLKLGETNRYNVASVESFLASREGAK